MLLITGQLKFAMINDFTVGIGHIRRLGVFAKHELEFLRCPKPWDDPTCFISWVGSRLRGSPYHGSQPMPMVSQDWLEWNKITRLKLSIIEAYLDHYHGRPEPVEAVWAKVKKDWLRDEFEGGPQVRIALWLVLGLLCEHPALPLQQESLSEKASQILGQLPPREYDITRTKAETFRAWQQGAILTGFHMLLKHDEYTYLCRVYMFLQAPRDEMASNKQDVQDFCRDFIHRAQMLDPKQRRRIFRRELKVLDIIDLPSSSREHTNSLQFETKNEDLLRSPACENTSGTILTLKGPDPPGCDIDAASGKNSSNSEGATLAGLKPINSPS